MASITFTDATGTATLDNGMTGVAAGVGSRFSGWTSYGKPIGPARNALGTGTLYRFTFRIDYSAKFEMQQIPNANVAVLDRLILHLLSGGIITVTTGDGAAHTYNNCCLAPGAEPEKRMMDPREITWALGLVVINLSAAPMTCLYSS